MAPFGEGSCWTLLDVLGCPLRSPNRGRGAAKDTRHQPTCLHFEKRNVASIWHPSAVSENCRVPKQAKHLGVRGTSELAYAFVWADRADGAGPTCQHLLTNGQGNNARSMISH